MQKPVTDLRELGHTTRSTSEKACNFNSKELENNNPCLRLDFIYLSMG